jgi:putative addiction module component (TIGR02574 family)
MTPLLAELAEKAQALSPEDREALAEWLMQSLEPANEAVDAAWEAELKRRMAAIDAGEPTIPAEEVFAEMRRRFG